MARKIHLQTKLVVSVALAIVITLSAAVAIITVFEKNRFRELELNRVFYKTEFLVRRLGHLMYNSNWRYLNISLTNSMAMDRDMLYYVLKNRSGDAVSSSAEGAAWKKDFDAVVKDRNSAAIYEREPGLKGAGGDDGHGNFKVYVRELSGDIAFRDTVRAEKGDLIFEACWQIHYLGEKLGTLQMGFSRQSLVRHLLTFQASIIGVSLCLLAAAMLMIVFVVNRNMRPLGKFVDQLSSLKDTKDERDFRDQIGRLDFSFHNLSIVEIENLNVALDNIKSLFIKNWDQLEDYRRNLENKVTERTRELNEANLELQNRIEERKAIEDRLVNAQKLEAIGTLVGGIAHEFNNLFMGIQGNAFLMKNRPDDPGKVADKSDNIMKIVDKGAGIVKQLMGFSRKGGYAPGIININNVIESNISMFLHAKKNLNVEMSLAEDLWQVNADVSQMDQSFLNLFLNASESAGNEGSLYIRTENIVLERRDLECFELEPGCFVKVMVSDTGKGMDQNELSRIFDPFYTTKKMGQGTGLGLASVYGIIRNHGGFIKAESEPGRGTTFYIYLPAVS
ncbi:MAG: ATP-binding protein [Thermodesulfobacteriota bacterium]